MKSVMALITIVILQLMRESSTLAVNAGRSLQSFVTGPIMTVMAQSTKARLTRVENAAMCHSRSAMRETTTVTDK